MYQFRKNKEELIEKNKIDFKPKTIIRDKLYNGKMVNSSRRYNTHNTYTPNMRAANTLSKYRSEERNTQQYNNSEGLQQHIFINGQIII